MLRLTLWLGCVALAAAAAVPRRRASESLAVLEGLLQQQRDENNNVRINNNSNSYDSGNEDTDARIVGGTIVAPGTYPFFAYGAGTILCGATLIYEDILLTAAHCDGAFIQNGALIGGTQLDGSDATRIEVESELPSPDYDDATRLNDIMLVKLREPSTAPLATLNLDAIVPVEGDPVTVTGFGDTADGGEPSPVLLDVTVDTFSDEFCDALYNVYEPDTMICAGTVEGGRDSCQGDSGGPLFTADLVQVGIVSTGSGCAVANVPAIYTEVAAFQSFIRRGICDLSNNPPDSCLEPTSAPTAAPLLGGATAAPTATSTGVGNATESPVGSETLPPTFAPSVGTIVPFEPTEGPTPLSETLGPSVGTEAPTAIDETRAPNVPSTKRPVGPTKTFQPTAEVTLEPSMTFEPTFAPTKRMNKPHMMRNMMGMMKSGKGGKGKGGGGKGGKGGHKMSKRGKGSVLDKTKKRMKTLSELITGHNQIFTNDEAQKSTTLSHLVRNGLTHADLNAR